MLFRYKLIPCRSEKCSHRDKSILAKSLSLTQIYEAYFYHKMIGIINLVRLSKTCVDWRLRTEVILLSVFSLIALLSSRPIPKARWPTELTINYLTIPWISSSVLFNLSKIYDFSKSSAFLQFIIGFRISWNFFYNLAMYKRLSQKKLISYPLKLYNTLIIFIYIN